MWTKLVGVLMIGMLLSLPIDQQVLQGVQASVQAREVINGQVSRILADGDAMDEIPVIITLQNAEFARSLSTDSISLQQRISTVRSIQRNFASRNATRIQIMERQPQYHTVVFGQIRRQDVAIIANDSAVVGVQEDKPMPLLMDESTVIVGSVVANQAGYGGAGMTVAVLDTGVAKNHEFLSGQVVAEACFSNYWSGGTSLCPRGTSTTNAVSNDVDSATPCVGYSGCDHGTHVAGTVAGKVINKGSYVLRGVAPDAKIIGVQVFTYFASSGGISSYSADQIMAMDWLITHRGTAGWGTLAALNMSLGGGQYATTCDSDNSAMKSYIDTLRGHKVATIIASGNNSWSDSIASPACISSAIAVGASTTSVAIGYGGTTAVDQVAYFSNAPTSANNGINGNGDRLLDLLAPGFFINSATSSSTTSYSYKAGTSMATPHVAGAWALMKQAAPTASVAQILQWLFSTGTSITDTRNALVLPRINVDDAVTVALIEPTPTNTATSTATHTASATRTATSTATHTASATRTATSTATHTASATRTATSATQIATSAATHTASATRTSTRTATRTSTRTATRTSTRTASTRPSSFNKSSPANNLTNRPLTLTLSWAASGVATSYEYCLATSAAACTNWKSVGTARSVTVRSLARNRTYFWNVRAKNTAGTTVANGGIWKFTTIR
jgi:subtilisin family serine protease